MYYWFNNIYWAVVTHNFSVLTKPQKFEITKSLELYLIVEAERCFGFGWNQIWNHSEKLYLLFTFACFSRYVVIIWFCDKQSKGDQLYLFK